MHAAIDSAEKGEVSRERRDIVKRSVADPNGEHVISADAGVTSHLEPEHPEAAAMLPQVIAVNPDVRHDVGAVEVNPQLASRFAGIDKEMNAVKARPSIIGAEGLPVMNVPGVGY